MPSPRLWAACSRGVQRISPYSTPSAAHERGNGVIEHLSPQPSPCEVRHALIGRVASPNEGFCEAAQLGTGGEKIGREERTNGAGKWSRLAVAHHVAGIRCIVGPDAFVVETKVVDDHLQGSRPGADRVGAVLDQKSVRALRSNRPAHPIGRFEDLYRRALLIELVGSGESGDAGPNDSDGGHGQEKDF